MREDKTLSRLREGVVGEFTPLAEGLLDQTYGGMVRLGGKFAEVTLVADEQLFDEHHLPKECAGVFGTTAAGDIVVVAPRRRSGSRGSLATGTYASKYLLLDVNTAELDGDKVCAVQHLYYGIPTWGQAGLYVEQPIVEDGVVVGWQCNLRYGDSFQAKIDDEFSVRFSAAYKIAGEHDRRTIAMPVAVTIESPVRVGIHDHAVRLDAVHALLNVVHREPVQAFGGHVKIAPESEGWCGYWDADLMSSGARTAPTNEFAHLDLASIGGVEGVARWVALVLKHRRAVVPIIRHKLFANQTPEARLLSTASSIEYWVAAHRRVAQWAKAVPNKNFVDAVADIVDPSWRSWIGRPDAWSKEFWDTYNQLKHDPEIDHDPNRVHALEVSGRWLLTAALLDSCAESAAPSEHLFSDALGMVGSSVRKTLGYETAD